MRADDLRALRERVLAATGSDRELDAHLCALDSLQMAFCNFDEGSYHGECASPGCGRPLGLMDERTSYPRNWEDDERLPRYTGSLDAAVALCERVLPGSWGTVDFGTRGPMLGRVSRKLPGEVYITEKRERAATPALAVIAALLSSLLAEPAAENATLKGEDADAIIEQETGNGH